MIYNSSARKSYSTTEFGLRVKKRLIDMGMTQKQLAMQIGLGPVYLTVILKGRRSGEKYINKIKSILNID